MTDTTIRYHLPADRLPTAWFNALPRLPEPLQPPLHPGTREPIGPEALARERRGGVDGGHHIEPLRLALAVLTARAPDAAEVEAHGGHTGLAERPDQRVDDVVAHVAAVQRVRVAHHRGRPRAGRHGGLGVEHDAVDGLQGQALGFDAHGADGTVAPVPEADPKLPIKMLNDRLLVKIPREDGERKSSGGILIPATAQVAKRLVWAEVVGVGQNVRTIQVGDHVLFSPEDRYEVEVRGDDYLILRERDIHAVAAERVEGSTGLYL